MITDDKLFTAHVKDLGNIDEETLNMKTGNLTVRELIMILRIVKSGRSPSIISHSGLQNKIIDLLRMQGDEGLNPWSISQVLSIEYSLVKYHMKRLLEDKKVIKETQTNPDKRKVTIYKLVQNGTDTK